MSILLCLVLIAEGSPFSSSSPFMIDTSKVWRSAVGAQTAPSVASDGVNYFVVWADGRRGGGDIWGTRVNRQGVVIDTPGFIIAAPDSLERSPKVAFDGANFFVVWCDNDIDNGNVYGARVGRDGILIDSNAIPISTAPRQQCEAALAFDGQNYLVVWQDARNSATAIYGARVTRQGAVLDPSGIRIAPGGLPRSAYGPCVAYGDSNYFVVWEQDGFSSHDIYGTRVNRDGGVLDPAGIMISTAPGGQGCAHVSFGSGRCLVTWHDTRNTGWDIYGARVRSDGTVLDPQGIPIDTNPDSDCEFPFSVFNGAVFLVSYRSYFSGTRYIHAKRVTADGVVADSLPISIPRAGDFYVSPAPVVFEGADYFLVWGNVWGNQNNKLNIFGGRIDSSGQVIDTAGFLLNYSTDDQYQPCAAFDGRNYLAAWCDRNLDSSRIRGARVTPTGYVLDPQGFVIGPRSAQQLWPAIAFDGRNYLVAWYESDSCRVRGARITPGGTVLDTALSISRHGAGYGKCAVAYDNRNYFATWCCGQSVIGARISADGRVLDTSGITITRGQWPVRYQHTSLAFDGRNYLAVWIVEKTSGDYDIGCARVTPEGVVLDTSPILLPANPAPLMNFSRSAVAFNGQDYLIAWCDRSCYVYGARVTPSGSILDTAGFRISYGPSGGWSPSVALDGSSNFFVTWNDSRNDYGDIYGCRVTPSGMVLDTTGIPILRARFTQMNPYVVSGSGKIFTVCNGFAPPPYGSERVWGVFYSPVGVAEPVVLGAKSFALDFHPNPCTRHGVISFSVPNDGDVAVDIFDATGRKVRSLLHGRRKAGAYRTDLDFSSDNGQALPAGVYFLGLRVGERQSVVQKILIIH